MNGLVVITDVSHLNEAGFGNISLGCDFGGIEVTPNGFDNVSSLKTLSAEISGAYDDDISQGIMYRDFIGQIPSPQRKRLPK